MTSPWGSGRLVNGVGHWVWLAMAQMFRAGQEVVGKETGCHQGYARDLGRLSFRGQGRPKGLERGQDRVTLRGSGRI